MSEKSTIRLMAEITIKRAIKESVAQELMAGMRRDPSDKDIENQSNHKIHHAISDGPEGLILSPPEDYEALLNELVSFGKQNEIRSKRAEAVLLLALEWAISDELEVKDLSRETDVSNEEKEEHRKNRLFGVITDVTREHGDDSPKTIQAVWDKIKTFKTFET